MSGEASKEIVGLRKELDASEARFFNVVDISPDGVVVIDKAGDICFINDAAQLMFGRRVDELLGKEFGFPFVSGKKAEIEILTADGKQLIVEMRVVKIVWEQQLAYLASLRDITEHNQLINKLNLANQELVRFGFAVSHDIKAPLRNVHTLACWLIEEFTAVLDDRVTSDLRLIEDNVNRTLRLVDGLLQFTQIGESNNKFTVVDLNAVFEEAIDNINTDLTDCGAVISIDHMPCVEANGIQLVLLFQNLLSNSIKYCESTIPKVNVSAQQNRDEWEISIADNGIGIEPQYLDKIFLPFERLHTQNEYEGSGIGLATCKKIVERHNGFIRVESEVGEGSTFVISLPASLP